MEAGSHKRIPVASEPYTTLPLTKTNPTSRTEPLSTTASPSVLPANVVDKMILDTCGRMCIESLARLNRQSCFSKTCPATSASALERSPETLKAWVTTLRRDSLRRRKLAQATKENGYSSGEKKGKGAERGEGQAMKRRLAKSQPSQQPGVDANKLVTKNGDPATAVDQRLYLNGLHRTVGLPQQVTLWGTPADYSRGGGRSRSGKRIGELLLPGQAKMWATPQAEERCQQNSRDDYVALSRQAPLWPTPNVPNGGRTVQEQQMQAGTSPSGRKVQKPLARTAELWPTPRTITGGARRGREELGRKNSGEGDLQPATKACPTPRISDYRSEQVTRKHSTRTPVR